MELEEAKNICNEIIRTNMFDRNTDANAIETVLQALDNSISKEKVRENIRVLKQTPRREFCNYDDYTFGSIRALEKILEE